MSLRSFSRFFIGYLPAPSIDVPAYCTFSQFANYVADRTSLKKSICQVHFFLNQLLKEFLDGASTFSCERLFHLLLARLHLGDTLFMTRRQKNMLQTCIITAVSFFTKGYLLPNLKWGLANDHRFLN